MVSRDPGAYSQHTCTMHNTLRYVHSLQILCVWCTHEVLHHVWFGGHLVCGHGSGLFASMSMSLLCVAIHVRPCVLPPSTSHAHSSGSSCSHIRSVLVAAAFTLCLPHANLLFYLLCTSSCACIVMPIPLIDSGANAQGTSAWQFSPSHTTYHTLPLVATVPCKRARFTTHCAYLGSCCTLQAEPDALLHAIMHALDVLQLNRSWRTASLLHNTTHAGSPPTCNAWARASKQRPRALPCSPGRTSHIE
jgi:hypothetical protein